MTTSPLLPLTAADLPPLAPELVLIGSAFALMILDLFVSNRNKIVTHLFSLAALAVVLFLFIGILTVIQNRVFRLQEED